MEEKKSDESKSSALSPAEVPSSKETPAPKESHKSKLILSKWMVAVFAVLLVTLLAVGGFAMYLLNKSATPTTQITVSPTATPAAQFKTYTNTKHNYSIDYPSDWEFKEDSDSKNGASFNPLSKPGSSDTSDAIRVSADQALANYFTTSFEEYVKVEAKYEIQNYDTLASIKKVTTGTGIIGWEATWMVQPMMGMPKNSKSSESLPITYFEVPGSKTLLVRVTLDRKEELTTYEKMLTTFIIPANLQITPTPTPDDKSVLLYVIRKYIALKYNSSESDFTLTVSKIEGNFAQGGVSDQGGGGMWFAAKEDGVWKLVWDGNGVIECSVFTLYPKFPTSMIPECYDTATQQSVTR